MYSDSMSTSRVQKLLHLLCAYPICLQEYVQGFRQPKILSELLTPGNMDAIDRVTNRPYFITNLMARELIKIEVNDKFTNRERQYMQKLIDDLTVSIGACERIVQTPVPLTYARHTSRFLSLFCLTAPVALVSELGFYIIPFVPLTAWSLFGIQEIGMIIEEPFQRALKLEIFSNTIRRDIADMVHMSRLATKKNLKLKSPALGYEVPFFNRVGDRLFEEVENQELTQEEVINQALQSEIGGAGSGADVGAGNVEASPKVTNMTPKITLNSLNTTDTVVKEDIHHEV